MGAKKTRAGKKGRWQLELLVTEQYPDLRSEIAFQGHPPAEAASQRVEALWRATGTDHFFDALGKALIMTRNNQPDTPRQ